MMRPPPSICSLRSRALSCASLLTPPMTRSPSTKRRGRGGRQSSSHRPGRRTPDNALVLSVDEKTQIQALDRTHPLLPLRPGQVARRTHDYTPCWARWLDSRDWSVRRT